MRVCGVRLLLSYVLKWFQTDGYDSRDHPEPASIHLGESLPTFPFFPRVRSGSVKLASHGGDLGTVVYKARHTGAVEARLAPGTGSKAASGILTS